MSDIYAGLRKNAQTLYARGEISQNRCLDLMALRPGGTIRNKIHAVIAWCVAQMVEATDEIQKETR